MIATRAARSLTDTWARCLAIMGIATALAWPAIFNGFPLLFPDSVAYLGQSHGILAKLRGHDMPRWSWDSMRSETFSATLAFLHHHAMLWPIVVFQALLTAWILWLVVRALCMRQVILKYLAIGGLLASLGGVSWYVSFVMPDILGPLLYLAFFLLVITPLKQSVWETRLLVVFAVWATTTHATHLLIASGLCCVFAVCWLMGWLGMRGCGNRLALFAGILVVSAATQMAIHERLYGQTSLFGHPPAFLMARLLGDGPARLYLQQNCANLTWTICRYADQLPTNESDFLWPTHSIWVSASPAAQEQLRREQTPLLLATLKTYPAEQAVQSAKNFGNMLVTMGPIDFGDFSVFTPAFLEFGAEGLTARYAKTVQARDGMPQRLFVKLQTAVFIVSLLVTLVLAPGALRRRQYLSMNLTLIVVFVLLANAFLSGVISTVDPRLQGRVAWLMVLLAALLMNNERERNLLPAVVTPL